MAKSRANLSLEADTHERAKRVYDNLSQRVEELLEADMDITKAEDEEMIERRVKELEQERDEVEQEIDKLQAELEGIESELSVAKASLEQARREKEEKSDELDRFMKLLPEKVENRTWTQASDIPDYWKEELEKPKSELWEMREDGKK